MFFYTYFVHMGRLKFSGIHVFHWNVCGPGQGFSRVLLSKHTGPSLLPVLSDWSLTKFAHQNLLTENLLTEICSPFTQPHSQELCNHRVWHVHDVWGCVCRNVMPPRFGRTVIQWRCQGLATRSLNSTVYGDLQTSRVPLWFRLLYTDCFRIT